MDNDNRTIRITFTVVCDSPICMNLGDTIEEKIKYRIKQCTEAIESEMRHWGDYNYFTDVEKVELISEDGNVYEISEELNYEQQEEEK